MSSPPPGPEIPAGRTDEGTHDLSGAGHTRRSFVARGGAVVAGASLTGLVAGLPAPASAAAATSAARVASAKKTRVAPTLSKKLPAALPRDAGAYPGTTEPVHMQVAQLSGLLQSGQISSVELTQAYYTRINQFNGPFETYADNGLYNGFVRVNVDGALQAANLADERITAARAGGAPAPLLCGIPMGFKDSVCVRGYSTQDGNAACVGNIALQDATIVANLRAQGVVPLGLTICSSFSGSVTGTFAGNAWNPLYIPGGSSQGSGAAAAGCLAAACIGEETGGSIIFPSACNGATGIKPSLGTVSIAGLMPLNPGYDVLGPICRSAVDAALILNAMIGIDPANDPQTLAAPIPFPLIPYTARTGSTPLTGLTIGIPQTDWMSAVNPTTGRTSTMIGVSPQSLYGAQHLAAFNELIANLESLGATVIQFPGLDMSNTDLNPYYASSTVLATVAGSPVSPSTALIDANRYEIGYVDGPSAFCSNAAGNGGIPTAASIAILTSNYGRKGPTDTVVNFASADLFNGGIPTQARAQGELLRRQLQENYRAALAAYGVDFMLIMQVGDIIGLRASGGGYTCSRAYFQVNNVLAWPTVSFPIGFSSAPNPVLPISAQFWGPRFSEPNITQAMIDYQANFPAAHTAIAPDPTPVPTARRVPAAVALQSEQSSPSNDNLIQEQRLREEMGQ